MYWVYVLFWTGVFTLCIYIINEINNGNTSDKKVNQIRGEMLRLEHSEQLNNELEVIQNRIYEHLTNYKQNVFAFYNDIASFAMDLRRRVIQLIIDIVTPRLYSIIG